jgi:hypothetical protein
MYYDRTYERGWFGDLLWTADDGYLYSRGRSLGPEWEHSFAVTTYINALLLRRSDLALSITGTRKIDDRDTVGVRVVLPEEIDFRSTDFYFDRVDGRLLMTSITAQYACMPLKRIETSFREFAIHDGVVWPSRWVTVESFIPHPTMHTPDRKEIRDCHLRSAQFPSTLGDESFRPPSR